MSPSKDKKTVANSIVIRVDPENRQWWKRTLKDLLPTQQVYLWDEDEFDPEEIGYAVVWMPPLGMLASLPKLRATMSVGAGVTHILRDASYPREIPIVRCVNQDLRDRMTEYMVMHTLRVHRHLDDVVAASGRGEWIQYVEPLARDVTVGILGVGNLGSSVAEALSRLKYEVIGWSRSGTRIHGMRVYSGVDGLQEVLRRSQILISLLPGTPATVNLLDRVALQTLPTGAHVINAGRGETIVDQDLIALIDQGHLSGATLDVFREEPLPSQHPFWAHPRILITCHTASAIEPATGGRTIADSIREWEAGEISPYVVDISRGY